jgi:hypothetical protein
MNILSKIFIGFFAALVAIILLINALAPAITPIVSLENITFTTNNTYYKLAHSPTNLDLKLYYYSNTTYQIPASRVVANTTHVKIYTNGTTVCFANITAGCFYYASYTWNQDLTLWGMDFGWILIIVFLAVITYVGWSILKSMIKVK